MKKGAIGVFDSGYGGLTVLKEIVKELPEYDYLYLGDNARTPYGTRSFETIYEYTLECVQYLFDQGCHLVILACNTASSKALRNIQQIDLPKIAPDRRVLGVIRPTAEIIGMHSKTRHIGVLGTNGTVKSASYIIEINKLNTDIAVHQQACPMWVPLVENGEAESDGADYFIRQDLDKLFKQSASIDTILLACTHYPLLIQKIQKIAPKNVTILSQGEIVAKSLKSYLERNPEMESKCAKKGEIKFLTTDSSDNFNGQAARFYGREVKSTTVHL